ncbi:MAG: NADAR family protein [Pirellulaceae bacterium]
MSHSIFLFYGHKPPAQGVDASCLSQWFHRPFVIADIEYPTAEHWMMAEKARLFGDEEMLKQILVAPGPREAKALGRKVAGFDTNTWNENRFEIVKAGNRAKFSQHSDLNCFLQATALYNPQGTFLQVADKKDGYLLGETPQAILEVREKVESYHRYDAETKGLPSVVLVEAAGRDTIWGIGLGEFNPKASDPNKWRGQNLLGFALTAVRESLQI